MRRVAAAVAVAATLGGVGLAAARAESLRPVAVASAAVAGPPTRGQDSFPHLAHQGLFPLCAGCHQGVSAGDEAAVYPEPSTCDGCHDGQEQRQVDWTPPVPGAEPGLLDFTHPSHGGQVQAAGDEPLECASCHVQPGGPTMAVEPVQAARCLTCHGDAPERHIVDAPCASCHISLASSGLPTERIAGLEVPSDHEGATFLAGGHGELIQDRSDRCATCHTRERCLTCHVDAERPTIQAMPEAGPQLELPPAEARYPLPESHESADFEREHGPLSQERACTTCHTRDDCASCHLPPLPETASGLPLRRSVLAPGVGLLHEAPATHSSPFFMVDHSVLAASDGADCATCHTTAFCVECHDAPQEPGFHPVDYVASHQADAWNQTAECADCHDTAAFCRSCHVSAGFESQGRLGPGYHDAEPLWLLRHGQAARQSLESCASCHTQRQCLQCHSTLGAFRVSPHRPGFDARRAWERNPGICLACHLENPLGGGSP